VGGRAAVPARRGPERSAAAAATTTGCAASGGPGADSSAGSETWRTAPAWPASTRPAARARWRSSWPPGRCSSAAEIAAALRRRV